MKTLNRTLIVLLAGGLFASGMALAAGGKSPSHEQRGMPGERLLQLADELDLTTEQRSTMKAILLAAKTESERLQAQQSASRQRFKDTEPDASDYGSVTQEIANDAANLARERVLLISDIRAQTFAVLTEEQRQKLDTLRAEHGAGRGNPNRRRGAPATPGGV